jgi:hypothetical protein
MKLTGSLLLVAAMVVGSFGATGCKSQDKAEKITDNGGNAEQETPATPEDNPDTAPVSTEPEASHDSPAGLERDALVVSYWAPFAPPAVRVEERGVAPGPGYFWRAGYYGWGGRSYRWNAGRWYAPRPGYAYYGPSWHHWGGRWGYRPGRWYRR